MKILIISLAALLIPTVIGFFIGIIRYLINPNSSFNTKNVLEKKENNSWICNKCKEEVDEEFEICWNCSTQKF